MAAFLVAFLIDSKGLSESDLRKVFRSAIITISWVTKEFVVGDLLQFNHVKGGDKN
ncbi:hypothetical protein [Neobacillus niacini]|uniref:hypothetical protein n=1 Tax=Neobacillus niacini TaxID=86668 RepID=UPI00285A2778|nr:hypothetical protein [Neobacillus niacini]MDR6997794.1 hypothetical protein [Neobacillus niacini]